MYLFFDTETTGVSRYSDHVVQVAWMLTDISGNIKAEECHVVRPDGFDIPAAAARIHGITTTIAHNIGKSLNWVLSRLSADVTKASVAIAHNISFDIGILQHDYDNAGLGFPFHGKTQVCTMKLSTTWCRIPKLNGSSGFKYPKLEELHYRLFGEAFSGAHDALADTKACKRCYFELVKRGVITAPPPLPTPPPFKQEATKPLVDERSSSTVRHQQGTTTVSAKPTQAPIVATSAKATFPSWVEQNHAALIIGFGYDIPPSSVRPTEFKVIRPDKSYVMVRGLGEWVKVLEEVALPGKGLHLGAVTYLLGRLNEVEREKLSLQAELKNDVEEIENSIVTVKEPHGQTNTTVDASDESDHKRDESDEKANASKQQNKSVPFPDWLSTISRSILEDKNYRFLMHKGRVFVVHPDGRNTCLPSESELHDLLAQVFPDVKKANRISKESIPAKAHQADSCSDPIALPKSFPEWLNRRRCFDLEKNGYQFRMILGRLAVTKPDGSTVIVATPKDIDALVEVVESNLRFGACSDEVATRIMAASNPLCPVDVLRDLSIDSSHPVVVAVASNPRCPLQLLEAIAEDSYDDDDVAEALAKNPAAYGKVLPCLVWLGSDRIAWIARQNPLFTESSCRRFIIDYCNDNLDEYDRAEIIESSICPPDILEHVSTFASVAIRLAVAKNKRTPESVLVRLSADDPDEGVREAAYGNSTNPVRLETLETLTKHPDSFVRRAVANNKNCQQALLETLRRDKDANVRLAAIKHGAIFIAELVRLASDPDAAIRKFVAEHELVSVSILERLASDDDAAVRLAVALNHKTAQTALSKLSREASSEIRQAVAKHHNAPESALLTLANDPDGQIRLTVARRADLPASVFRALAHSKFHEYRQAVAINPSCPDEVLEELTHDSAKQVSSVAKKRLAEIHKLKEPPIEMPIDKALLELGIDIYRY